MNQQEPQYDDIWDALRACVAALGGPKQVGHSLRPEMDPEKAGRWLSDCLNTERNEKLGMEQVLWILREAHTIGCHVGMNYIANASGYTSTPIDPAAERAAMVQAVVASARATQAAMDALQRSGLLELAK